MTTQYTVPAGWTKGEPVRWTPVKDGSMWRIVPTRSPVKMHHEKGEFVEVPRDELMTFRAWWST